MRQTRVYLPLSRSMLLRLAASGSVESNGGSTTAFAVTHLLQRAHPGVDEEGLEYLAFLDAARAARVMREHQADRRVLAAADVESTCIRSDPDEGGSACGPVSRVHVTQPVPLARIASFHVEQPDQPEDGRAEDDSAEAGTDVAPEPHLLWYDASELDVVVGMFR